MLLQVVGKAGWCHICAGVFCSLCRKAHRNKVFLDFWKLGSEVCKRSLVLLVVVAVSGKTLKRKIRRAKFSCSDVASSQS